MARTTAVGQRATFSSGQYWPPPQGQWTYEDYTCLPDNGMRYEVVEGNLYMSPAPRPQHQRIIASLYGHLWDYLKDHPQGEVLFAPIDVNLPQLTSPVQPDLLFIAHDRLGIVQETAIEGVPNLIVEVPSPSNPTQVRSIKFQIYAKAGVSEYWVIDLETCTVEVNVLRGRAYVPLGIFSGDLSIRSEVLADFTMAVEAICVKAAE